MLGTDVGDLEPLELIVFFNVMLALFNLLPIPPLDGYEFALSFLPHRQAIQVQRYAQYGFFVLLRSCSCHGARREAVRSAGSVTLALSLTRVLVTGA